MPKSAFILTVLILAALISAIVGVASAVNANFVVSPQDEHAIPLSLQENDKLSGSFSVVSDDETGIDFYIVDPQNTTIYRLDNVKQGSFSLTSESKGSYALHFDNSVSASYSKTVVLNYEITHYVMGMPQEQFLFLVVAAVALIGILAFILLQPR